MPDVPTSKPTSSRGRLDALEETGLLDALPQASLDRFTRIAALAIGVPVALVSLVDHRRQFFSSLVGLPEPWATKRETPLTHSFCKMVVAAGDDLIVSDARNDPRVAGHPAIAALGVIAYAGKPIRTGDGHVLGSFCVVDSKPRQWTPEQLTLLGEIRDAVTAEIELRRRTRRFEQSEQLLAEATNEALEAHHAQAATSLASRKAVHDVRAPLSVITLGIGFLRGHEAVKVWPEIGRTFDRIERNARHMASLLTEMANLGVSVGDIVSCDLAQIATEVATDRKAEHVVPRHPVIVPIGETQLRRSIENLVSNALRFMKNRVRVTVREEDDGAALIVDDDGDGLPDAAYENLWVLGVRFHVESGRSGTGLGLAIVKQVVEAAGGQVEAGPSELGGARFVLRFPIERVI